MDKRLKSIAENYDNLVIGLDDTFRFHCKICGNCCIHREDIILNPKDIYNVAKALDKEPHEIVAEYCETYLGQSSKMVLVRLTPRGSVKRCPFLSNLKCSIHKYKPTVCALYPLGRSLKAPRNGCKNILNAKVEYIFQKPTCGDASETHSVREWLSEFNLLEDEEYFKTWMQLAVDLGNTIRRVEDECSTDVVEALAASVLASIYLDYNTSEPFMPQFLRNEKEYRKTLSELLQQFGIPNKLNS